jgi:hypothetical protein
MLKKLLLLLCLSSLVAWAAPAKARKAKSKKATPVAEQTVEAPAASADSDDGFMSVSESAAPAAKAADDDDEDENVEASTAGMTAAQRQDYFARKKFEEEQRLDEYANSERRRDWLKDRLIFEIGLGSRMPFMGESGMGMGLGAGIEYITRWHIAAFASFGFLPKVKDSEFDYMELEGGTGYKIGISYYFFPKIPIHLGLSASYGTVYFDHDMEPDENGLRSLISVKGFQFDILISYLSNEWYYLQFAFGMYYAPDLGKAPEKNPSFKKTKDSRTELEDTYASRVVNKPDGMDKTGIVFGVTIGFALPEFFPDDTEKRRRQREKERKNAK